MYQQYGISQIKSDEAPALGWLGVDLSIHEFDSHPSSLYPMRKKASAAVFGLLSHQPEFHIHHRSKCYRHFRHGPACSEILVETG